MVATYDSASVAEARAVLAHGIERRVPVLTLTGKVGSGTSSVLRSLHERFADTFDLALPSEPPASVAELAVIVLRLLGRPFVDAPAAVLMATLAEALAVRTGPMRPAALLLDDAHELPDEVLEALTLLGPPLDGEEARLPVVLAGRPGLLSRLGSARLGALRRGLTIDVRLLVPTPLAEAPPAAAPVPLRRARQAPRRIVLAVLVGCLCAATTLYLEDESASSPWDTAPHAFVPGRPRESALAALVVPRAAGAAATAAPDADEPGAEARRLVLAFQDAVARGDGESIRSLLVPDVRYNGSVGVDAAIDDQVWLGRGGDRPRFAPPDAVRRDGPTVVVEAPFHVPYRDVAGVRGELAGRARWRLRPRGAGLAIVQVDYDVVPAGGHRADG